MRKALFAVSLCVIGGLFVFYRVPSLLAHYVAYTYDQGRDFLAGASIVLNHKIPFIGPTTGINGLFHGSWWYYLLVIPYILFKGAPIGYYWFNFAVQLSLLIILMVFLKKEFGVLTSLMFGLVVAIAPYFTFMSLFVGNNVMVLPALLIFLICNYYLFKNKKAPASLLFATGLFLSLVGEFELSFGIFLIPLYFAAIFLFSSLRKTLLSRIGVYFVLGLAVGFAPRILFELKNRFMQTKVLLNFLIHPKLYNNPAPYFSRVSERFLLFKGYFLELFSSQYFAYVFLFSFFIIAGLTVYSLFKKKKHIQPVFYFYVFLLLGLFFLSTLYKDFFWKNYYEGIHYIFLFVFATMFGHFVKPELLFVKRGILISLLVALLGLNALHVRETLANAPPFDGLRVQETVADYILANQDQSKQYCLRIYTPSVIPHTYNYLFLTRNMKPGGEWVDNSCWFIVEADSYKKRRDDWLSVNEPKDKNAMTLKTIKDVQIRHYQVLPKK